MITSPLPLLLAAGLLTAASAAAQDASADYLNADVREDAERYHAPDLDGPLGRSPACILYPSDRAGVVEGTCTPGRAALQAKLTAGVLPQTDEQSSRRALDSLAASASPYGDAGEGADVPYDAVVRHVPRR